MAASGFIITNNNGQVTRRSLTNEELSKMTFSSIEDLFSPLLTGPIFSIPGVRQLMDQDYPRTKRSSVSRDYPPSKKVMNEKKRITWKVGLCGLGQNDVYVSLDGNIITVEVLNDVEPDEEVINDYGNLRLPKKGDNIKFKFDQMFYDPSTLKVEINNGLMLISIDPRKELQPMKKDLLGKKPVEKTEEAVGEEPAEETSEKE